MSGLFFRSRLIIAIICAIVLLASSCKKSVEAVQENILQQYFEQNILNRDFKVKLATDNGTDLTPGFEGYVFRLLKNTLYDGPMTATKNGVVYNGTWSSNEDYGKLIITFTDTNTPTEFDFLDRSWRFTKKAIPVMELAPWGTTDPKVLHMERL